jgi:hypothetical protein
MSDCNQAEPGETGADRGSLKPVFNSGPRPPIKSYTLAAASKSVMRSALGSSTPGVVGLRKKDADAHAFRQELTFTRKEA